MDRKFVTAINCMDGRVQYPVTKWLRKYFEADFVDMITEPGADKVFCEELEGVVESLKCKITLSIERHNSQAIAVVGHHDCAGNNVCKEEHYQHIELSVEKLKILYPSIKVIGLFVNENWCIEVVA